MSRARGGGDRDRTDDLLRARQALSQLSYTPTFPEVGDRMSEIESTDFTRFGLCPLGRTSDLWLLTSDL